TYDDLRLRDPHFGDGVDRWYISQRPETAEGSARLITPSPLLAPLRLRLRTLPNRVVVAPLATADALDGMPGLAHLAELAAGTLAGAGVVMPPRVASSAAARVTPGDPGMYRPEHAAAWRLIVDTLHAEASTSLACVLGHAGRRGSTRPRAQGLDRPL